MTNGEKIKAMFPSDAKELDMSKSHLMYDGLDYIKEFRKDWWNEEYKEPTTKNDLGVDCIVDVLGSYTDLDIPYKHEIAENILTKLSSVTPIRPKGHWIEERNEYGEIEHWHCSNCYDDSGFITTCKWDYCPNCGSDNREVEK